MINCPICGEFTSNLNKHICKFPLDLEPKVKPTLGVMPEQIWKQIRMGELGYAIMNRIDASQQVPVEWLEEYNKLQKELSKNGEKLSSNDKY